MRRGTVYRQSLCPENYEERLTTALPKSLTFKPQMPDFGRPNPQRGEGALAHSGGSPTFARIPKRILVKEDVVASSYSLSTSFEPS